MRNIADVYLGFSIVAEYINTTFQKQTTFVFRWTTVLRIINNLKCQKPSNSYVKKKIIQTPKYKNSVYNKQPKNCNKMKWIPPH
jgi:hypothetical protein